MEEPITIIGNQKRAWWRNRCRQHLAEHIRETLGIQVTPAEVRLLETEGMQYSWKIKDPSLSILFKKHLSKHSVRAYMRLYREVGRSFNAIHRGIPSPVSTPPAEVDKDEAMSGLKDDTYSLVEELKEANERLKVLEEAKAAAEKKMGTQEVMLQEAQTTIQFHQHDAQQWMSIAETYQNSCIQCSNALSQLISMTEGIQSQVSGIYPGSAQF